MPYTVNHISKVSQFNEATSLQDDDLLYISQDQGDGSYISKKLLGSALVSGFDSRYIKKIDVYYYEPYGVVLINT